jgi:amidase
MGSRVAAPKPMTHTEISELPASQVARLVASAELSPVEVVSAALERVDGCNPTLNAIVTINDQALADAQRLESALAAGEKPGPLCGVPVGIKDVTPVAGMRTTYGSPIHADHVPKTDALVVQRLRDAGAIIIGKTNTPEFAAGGSTFNDVFGRTRNPWNPTLTSGGSTGGGAAAAATGMIAIAEGTDLGGSLRIPAAFCGLVGIRPSPGLVPTIPDGWLWDDLSVTGPMARSAQDVALALQVMAGPDPRAPMSQVIERRGLTSGVTEFPLEGLRLGYCPDIARLGIDPMIEEVCRSVSIGLAGAGPSVDLVDLDLSEAKEAFLHLRGVRMAAQMRSYIPQLQDLGDNIRGNIEAGLRVTGEQLAWAHAVRGDIWTCLNKYFASHDYLLTPTMAVPPFPVEQNYPEMVAGRPMETYVDWIAPTSSLSITGLPVASVPCGLDPTGMPVGLQVVGPPLSEAGVLGLCARIQEAHPIGTPDRAPI